VDETAFEPAAVSDAGPDAVAVQRRNADLERVRALVDLHEGRAPVPLLDDLGIAEVLRKARRIAVIGASSRSSRPSHGVMASLVRSGYEVVPVNPREDAVLGRACYPDLAAAVAAQGPVDIVDVFRNAEACPAHAREAVAVGAGCLWLQLGVVSWEAGLIAADAGIPVVMDRCTSIEVSRLLRR
jgi:predicted CoA-binding protein